MYKIIQKRKIWLSISSVFVVGSIIALAVWGLKFGIDFTGGSLLELRFTQERPTINEVQDALADLDLGSLIIQPVDEKGMILRFQNTSEEAHQEILSRLNKIYKEEKEDENLDKENSQDQEKSEKTEEEKTEDKSNEMQKEGDNSTEVSKDSQDDNKIENTPNIIELRYDSVGPSIGAELKRKSVYAIIMVLICIVLYVAWAFRRVSKPVASWKYGLTAIIALFHDVIITMGVFAFLGKFYGMEVNTPFVAAILTVLGYSVNDTIVVFDRIRENLPKSDDDFESTVNTSVNQTITRSINTSLTTLLVLLAILFFGGDSIKGFVLALSIGVFVGTYSSIFLASPILVVWEKFRR